MRRFPLCLCLCLMAVAVAGQWPQTVMAAEREVAASSETSRLQQALDVAVQRARPGTLGVAVLDMGSGARAGVHTDEAFPMMSVFKAPVAAAVLAQVEEGSLSLEQEVTLARTDLRDGSAVPSIGAQLAAGKTSFTIGRLLRGAVSESDNTAVDALLRVLGGPQKVTAFLQAHGLKGMRVDLGEGGVNEVFNDVRPGQPIPSDESEQAFDQRRERGYRAFLADPRNRSTPAAAVEFLRKLQGGELLSPASTQRLQHLMAEQTLPNRLRAGVPQGVRFAGKSGTSGTQRGRIAAYNDIGILTWPDGQAVIVAAFLSDSAMPAPQRDALFADLARAVARAARP
ncbi:class A beta-lactamase [Dyella jiangningensis]|uniref:Beta-lactamase n=1 Tax=Dyella jiangningensis TaxID=1379159 RepID=A0A328PCE8_9GAMM|nr:class A beta-lactamase [Dyella jiangningensis]RAO77826.1 serine hydrolase [Dyella jiangningensis]